MISMRTRIQLIVFALVTTLAVGYGAVTLFDIGRIVLPPYLVQAQFANAGGIYPHADVDLLGTNVGSVKELRAGPGNATTVVLAIDHDLEIPEDVTAAIGNKSAIGEQYVELTPGASAGPSLEDGDTIPLARTRSPLEVSTLLKHLEGLAASVPTRDLGTALDEMSLATDGLGPSWGRLIQDSDVVTRKSLAHVDQLIGLIQDARTVLDTQVDKAPETVTYLREVASLTTRLDELNPDFAATFAEGIRAGTQVTNILVDNQEALPLLLDNLSALTTVSSQRLPALRKTLVMFPWVLELGASAIRYCDEYDPRTGRAIRATCHYDADGEPIYAAHLSITPQEMPGAPPYLPCIRGYEATTKHHPDGTPVGGGRRQGRDAEPNLDAACTASPTDAISPNVRGAQNAHTTGEYAARPAPDWGMAVYDPQSGLVAAPDGVTYQLAGRTGAPPPDGHAGLAWLLTQPLPGAQP